MQHDRRTLTTETLIPLSRYAVVGSPSIVPLAFGAVLARYIPPFQFRLSSTLTEAKVKSIDFDLLR